MNVLRFRSEIALTETEYGLILLDGRDGAYWQLNQSAAVIVTTLLHSGDRHEAARNLAEQYDVSPDEAERDVGLLIASMIESGMATL